MLNQRIKTIIDQRVGIPADVRDALYDEIMREIEKEKSPLGRREGVTVMTPEASLAADHQIRGDMDKNDPKPRTV